MAFAKASKEKAKLRLAISGPSGAGKTFTALRIAQVFGKVAVLDSEHGSSKKYADKFTFDVDAIPQTSVTNRYEKAIAEAESAGYDILIIESLSNAWDAVKAEVDRRKSADKYNNGFNAWGPAGESWKSLMNRIESSTIHIIVTMRAKVEYSQEKGADNKTVIRKLGMAPEVRDGTEYILDAVLEMEVDHSARIGKTRCEALDGFYGVKPGEDLGLVLQEWLSDGVDKVKPLEESPAAKAIKIARELGLTDELITSALGTDDWENANLDGVKALCEEVRKTRQLKANQK